MLKATEKKRTPQPQRPWTAKTWTFNLPTGVARFPHLNEPTAYAGEDPKYSVGILYAEDGPEQEALETLFNEILDWAETVLTPAQKKKMERKLPIKRDMKKVNAGTDKEDYEETGMIFVEPRKKAAYKGEVRPVVIYDAEARRIEDLPQIGGGSVLNVNVTAVPYLLNGALGVTLYLNSAQLLELSEGFAGANPFETVEGYVAAAESDTDTPF